MSERRKECIRQTLAAELKRKRDAGQEVPGTEWLRSWTDEVTTMADETDIVGTMARAMDGNGWDEYDVRQAICCALTALQARGFVIVPEKPTGPMLRAGHRPLCSLYEEEAEAYAAADIVWRQMVKAALPTLDPIQTSPELPST
jgi:hypothetical protein